jgi:hypothetical protein
MTIRGLPGVTTTTVSGRQLGSARNFVELQREALLGPQGTLFGNTNGGAIQLVTRRGWSAEEGKRKRRGEERGEAALRPWTVASDRNEGFRLPGRTADVGRRGSTLPAPTSFGTSEAISLRFNANDELARPDARIVRT